MCLCEVPQISEFSRLQVHLKNNKKQTHRTGKSGGGGAAADGSGSCAGASGACGSHHEEASDGLFPARPRDRANTVDWLWLSLCTTQRGMDLGPLEVLMVILLQLA